MNLKIRAIREHTVAEKERLVLEVVRDTDVGEFAVFDTTYTTEGYVSNQLRNSYWFPDKPVKSGDLVVLYTKSGRNKSSENKDGSSTHFFYWGLKKSVWNDSGDCAVLLHIANWDSKGIPK